MLFWAFLAAVLGGCGAGARYVVDAYARQYFSGVLPVSTLCINVSGSFVAGVVIGVLDFVPTPLALTQGETSPQAIVGLAVLGMCGGFTTFSTAMLDVVQLLYKRHIFMACGYLIFSACAAVIAVIFGESCGSFIVFDQLRLAHIF